MQEIVIVSKKCKQCGAEFEGYNNQRYCSLECKAKYYADHYDKERQSEINKRSAARRKEKRAMNKGRKKYKGLSITEIAVLARKEGMTYGQYVSIHNI